MLHRRRLPVSAVAVLLAGCADPRPAPRIPLREAPDSADATSPEGRVRARVPGTYMETPLGETLPLPVTFDARIVERDPKCYAVDLDGDGRREIIVEWVLPEGDPLHCYRIYRQGDDGAHRLHARFQLGGGVVGGIRFLREPDPTLPWRAVIDIHGGAGWGTWYAIRPDGTGCDEVARPMRCEHRDLDGDGIYEWIVSYKHNEIEELRGDAHAQCIEVYRWDPASQMYRREWPRPGHRLLQTCAVVCDLGDDGAPRIVSLMDGAGGSPHTRRLCVYEIGAAGDDPRAQIAAAQPVPPVDILPLREVDGRIRIPLAIPGKAAEEYEYRGGALTRCATEDGAGADGSRIAP